MLETGEAAPDFTLPDQDGDAVTLSATCAAARSSSTSTPRPTPPAARRRPAACATTCPTTTRPARRCSASRPTRSRRVKKFHDKQGLNFTLLADEDHAVAEAYGVWVEKSMYGRTYWGAQRVDVRDRRATAWWRHVIAKVSPKTHDEEVLAAL